MNASNKDFKIWAENNFVMVCYLFFPSTVSASKEQILNVLMNSKDVGLSIEEFIWKVHL